MPFKDVSSAAVGFKSPRVAWVGLWVALVTACGGGTAAVVDTQQGSDAQQGIDAATLDARPADDLSALLEPLRANASLPALAGAVVGPRGLLALGATGVRKLGDPTPATSADRWHLGSDTKAMTSVLLGMYVDAGALSWNATLPSLFPELAASMHSGFASVTLAQMLSHRAGLGTESGYPDVWSQMWANQGPLPQQRREIAAALLTQAPVNTPGSTYLYSNFDYILAGAVIERLSGNTWEQLIEQRLFTPLGMTSCGFGAPATSGQIDQPWGHSGTTPIAPSNPSSDNPPALGPAGRVHCNLADWGTFVALFFDGGSRALISQDSIDRITTAWPNQEYGLGWNVTSRPWADGNVLAHDGTNLMFYASAWVGPSNSRAYLVVTNQGETSSAVDNAVGALIQAYPAR